MTQTNLTTAKYYQEVDEAEVPMSVVPPVEAPDEYPSPRHGSPATFAEKMVRWISLTMAVAVIICVAVIAVPYVASVSSHAPKNPIDWWLRLGGAEKNQTFEKFVRDAATKEQREIQERFHSSVEGTIDTQNLNWQSVPSAPVAANRH
ncbi:MAG TPA: hypothetical protein VGJ15_11290 [Pirellulales bacterium]|jgi:hypothetical protein